MKLTFQKIFGKKDVQEKVIASTESQQEVGTSQSDLCSFVYLPKSKGWIGKYPVTNLQYQRFLEAEDFADQRFWVDFPRYGPPPDYELQGTGEDGWQWLQDALKDKQRSPDGRRVVPLYWQRADFGIQRPLVPVVGVTWYEANAYAKWLQAHWGECEESLQNPQLRPGQLRLPRENEWVEAAGGVKPEDRYAWDPPGQATTEINEIIRRANVAESNIRRTTPVNQYPLGQSPLGVWDLCGNVWEWQANDYGAGGLGRVAERGGSGAGYAVMARLSYHRAVHPLNRWETDGFRLLLLPN